MTEGSKSMGAMDPMELWRQWYETSSKMWSDAMQGGRESAVDPYGLYRQWVSGMQEFQQKAEEGAESIPQFGGAASMGGVPNVDPDEVRQNMQRWMDATADSYRQAMEASRGMMDLAPKWMRVFEDSRQNLMQQEGIPSDPVSFGVQWYNATSGPVAEFAEGALQKDEVLGPASRFLESYTTFYNVFKKNAEENLGTLQMPSRSDISRVASLVIALEDKVDRIEEAFEDFEYGYTEPASSDSVHKLEERMDRVEGKLDRLLSAVENGPASSGPANGSQAASSGNGSSQSSPSQASQGGDQEEVKATQAAQRKARELGVTLSEVSGTGADGQITVEDVRKKGES
ncbi:E3 binding domain-containing protein [Rubrobacter aplysinae]|uniref:E3 binding domain-containing protein n=1 Tax=Rubrobacter aplysinae TaxID=909625 RepID=UPI00064C24A8|nr:E3 binding domain-containing protein [Rubrobacter aplysinae]